MKYLAPARCTAKLPDSFSEHHVCEMKFDGSRYQLHIGFDPTGRRSGNTLLSRHISKIDSLAVDRTDNVPHITATEFPELEGTLLDGEIFLRDFETTQSIMSCNPTKAIERQRETGLVDYHVFDCRVFQGKDISNFSLEKRRRVLATVIKHMNLPNVKIVKQWPSEDITKVFNAIVAAGGEGVIVKDVRLGYGQWAKLKKSFDVSCFISGYKEGNGKYSRSIGSIAISVYDNNGNEIEVGFASGFSDELRAEIDANRSEYIGRVVDIFAQEISSKLRLRHPTFFRFRDEMNKSDCTLENLKEAMKQKSRSRRKV